MSQLDPVPGLPRPCTFTILLNRNQKRRTQRLRAEKSEMEPPRCYLAASRHTDTRRRAGETTRIEPGNLFAPASSINLDTVTSICWQIVSARCLHDWRRGSHRKGTIE